MTYEHIWQFVATGSSWKPQAMALKHTESSKINVEVQIL